MAHATIPSAAPHAAPKATTGRTRTFEQRQKAITDHLTAAFCLAHMPGDTPAKVAVSIRLATARTNRALTLLKALSVDVCTTGRA